MQDNLGSPNLRFFRSRAFLYLMLVLTTAAWGGVYIILRHVNAVREQFAISVWEIVFLRFVPASLLFAPFVVLHWRESMNILREAWWPVFWMGMLTTSVYNLLLITGEERVPASVASMIMAVGPSATFVLSLLARHEHASAGKLIGLIVPTLGLVYISILGKSNGTEQLSIPHLMLIVGAPVSWSIATVVGKRVLRTHDPLLVTALSVIVGSLPLLIIPLFNRASLTNAAQLPSTFWASMAYLAVLATVFGFVIWYKALDLLHATQVSVFVFLVPLFGVLFAGFFEKVSVAVYIGGALILAGVLITNRSTVKEK